MKPGRNFQLLIILLYLFFPGTIQETIGQTSPAKSILINIFGGTNPYQHQSWNNWNVTLNRQSGTFFFADGTTSPITAFISASSSVVDNGIRYGGLMCPPEVLRYASHYTNARTLTLQHLDSAARYSITIYSSRYRTDSQKCFISIGNLTDTVNYVNNLSEPAYFPSIRPSVNNEILITLHKGSPSSYNYINGLKLEISYPGQRQPPKANAGPDQTLILPRNYGNLSGDYQSSHGLASLGWRQLAGPTMALNGTVFTAQTSLASLLEGAYAFEFFVTDTIGQTSRDTCSLWVRQPVPGDTLVTDTLGCATAFTVVILGSSSAAGKGAQPPDSAWVNQFNAYLKSRQLQSKVINLAKLGLTTYETLCPNDYIPPAGRPLPDTSRNISAALKFLPDAVIINLPSNDVYNGYSLQEQQLNYERTVSILTGRGIPFWVSTTQPRNIPLSLREQLMQMRDWTYSRFGEAAIDFWTDISNADGTINPLYAAGDGIHLNNAGHRVLFSRVVARQIIDQLCIRRQTAPVVFAGADQQVMMPVDSIFLHAAVEDSATLHSIRWSQLDGPTKLLIADSTKLLSSISRFIPGTYLLQCKATNIYGITAFDTLAIYIREDSANIPPTVATNSAVSVQLPVDSLIASGSAFDPDGCILYYHWEQLSGPNLALLSSQDSPTVHINALVEGNYSFRLMVYDNGGSTNFSILNVTVLPLQKNTVLAGKDTILPAGTTVYLLHGYNGNEFPTLKTLWKTLSGPNQPVFASPGELNTSISNLQTGTYAISLSVTNEFQVTSTDTVIITVLPGQAQTRLIQVNLYGGVNPYINASWNNWNLNSGLSSPPLQYDDGSPSGSTISLSAHSSIVDNGNSYGGIVCPPPVLRYASHYNTSRKITLHNLNPSSDYTVYIFSSRKSTGGAQSSIYTSGTASDTVRFTNNLTDTVSLTALKPDQSGEIVINVQKTSSSTYNYINGISIVEKPGATIAAVPAQMPARKQYPLVARKPVNLKIFPNPVRNVLTLSITGNPGHVSYTIFNAKGAAVKSGTYFVNTNINEYKLNFDALPAGYYILHLYLNGAHHSFTVVKIK